MFIAKHKPAPQLAPYVYEYTIARLPKGMPVEKCIPDGFLKLFIYLSDDSPVYKDVQGNIKEWGDGFSGHPVDEDFYVQADKPIDVIVCSFRPQGIQHFYNTPTPYFNNTLLPVDVFLGRQASLLKEQLLEAYSDAEKIMVMNRYFLKLLNSTSTPASAITYAQDIIHASNGLVNIEKLATSINTTRRSLERNFLKQVGMTPKYFSRVLRINYAFRQKQTDPICNWQDIIYNCGYFDQSHFIKEFKHFTGTTPELFYLDEHKIKEVCVGRPLEV
jgi:AraC-like DNA-binding protein